MNVYNTEIQIIATGEWITGPVVQGRATTARTAAQKAGQWYGTTNRVMPATYRASATRVGNPNDTFTQPVTKVLAY